MGPGLATTVQLATEVIIRRPSDGSGPAVLMEQLIEFTNNHLLLVGGTIMLALAVIFYELRIQAGSVSAVSATQAIRLINQGARIVDVRNEDQFQAGHIVDAINIPASELHGDGLKRLEKAKSVILVCDNGLTSGRCVGDLKKGGIENAYSLKGGVADWRKDNLPILSSRKESSDNDR